MFLRTWRVRHLVGSWIAYWVVLLLVSLREPIRKYIDIQRSGGAGSVSASVSGDAMTLLWIVGPPLLLFVLWLAARPKRAGARVP
jgi:hypothetical protein